MKCLQQAVNSLGPTDAVRRKMAAGDRLTLAAVNAADADSLVTAFKAKRVARYQDIAGADPARQQDLKFWTIRANK